MKHGATHENVAPANAAIEYETKAFWDPVPNSFMGTPSEQMDVAWMRHQQRIKNSILHHADMAMGSAVWIAGSDKEHSKNEPTLQPRSHLYQVGYRGVLAQGESPGNQQRHIASRTFREFADWQCTRRVEPSGRLGYLLVA